MNTFGKRIRELRQAKGHSLRDLAPLVDVGFSYLSKVECGKMDFGEYPSAALIHRLADVLEADEDELMLLAKRIPNSITNRVLEQPDVFLALARCDSKTLARIVNAIDASNS
ncbi:Helix-turn-helix domain protein [Novipirellula galeiformis]|uniref:Helix-turn-helix domain protein n=1 Tax=Novipirellula galeiformis TaxID=2528004 RepID=A0A5C6CNA8_9BACT|nr:helix-turn-helix transcriptional regulator [Novipirellula galeiformis]TWU25097.1 Helix-turn-helix domain protein [Novipirellula galeiformis]